MDPVLHNRRMTKADIDNVVRELFPQAKFIDKEMKRQNNTEMAQFCYDMAGYTKKRNKVPIEDWWPTYVSKIDAKLRMKR